MLDELTAPFTELLESPEMMHAAAVHLPVALAVIGVPIALFALVPGNQRTAVRIVGFITYLLLVATAYTAVRTGENAHDLVSSALPGYIWEDINEHESMAEKVWIFAAVTAALFLLAAVKARAIAAPAAFFALVASAATLGWVSQVGHHGGELVYEHGLGAPALYIETHRFSGELEQEGEEADQQSPVESEDATPAPEARLRYFHDVKPVLQEYCYGCHSTLEKKGGLDITSLNGILAGGEKAGPALRFGDSGASPILQYIRGERQPQMPKEEPALSSENVRLIERWIDSTSEDALRAELAQQQGAEELVAVEARESIVDDSSVDGIMWRLARKTRSRPRPLAAPSDDANFSGDEFSKFVERITSERQERLDRVRDATSDPGEIEEPTDAPDDTGDPASNEPQQTKPDLPPGANQTAAIEFAAPDKDHREILKDLRAAILADSPQDHRDGDTVERYTLTNFESTRRLRRDVRKQWLPIAPELPDSNHANPIDRFITAKLLSEARDPGLKPTSDSAFLRRAYLDTIGVIPSADEARAFLRDSGPDKRDELIGALLARDEDYAANWVPFWEDALCSSHGVDQFFLGMHGDYRNWILASFRDNKPYDIWVSELLDPFDANQPPAYVLRRSDLDVLQSAANTAQVFLGTAMKCASCHNHFSNTEWPQSRFLAFAGFFAPEDIELVRCEQPTGRIVPTDFAWDLPGRTLQAPAGTNERIAALTTYLTDPTNPRFAQTIINRLWKRYFGIALYEPADDYRDDTYVSHPQLLQWLASDFIKHDYDLKHTIRLILTSETYQQQYNPTLEDHFSLDDPSQPRFYQSPTLRKLWAEQLLDSINRATGSNWNGYARTFWVDDISSLMQALGRPVSRDEVSTDRPSEAGAVMGLELINSPEYHKRIYDSPRVAELATKLEAGESAGPIVDTAYLTALSRFPTEAERQLTVDFLNESPNAQESVGDMFWALFTSPEFQFIG